jgi:chorismate lyase/3-hydroxybenzoate synthase
MPLITIIGRLFTHDPSPSQLIVRTGAEQTRVVKVPTKVILEVAMPLLAGPDFEILGSGADLSRHGRLHLLHRPGMIAGVGLADPGLPPREAARSLYAAMLEQLEGHHLHRIWNYLPEINREVDGIENYRAFNTGRYEAFTGHFGPDFQPRLPAASAVGTVGGSLAVAFLAGSGPPRHFENPEQVPSVEYPSDYGLVPPAFARGTVVEGVAGLSWFLSGTASIKGHATLGGGIEEQARLTFDNVQIMFRRMGLTEEVAASWKIFLRHARDLPAARRAFGTAFPSFTGEAMFVQADICRSGLLLEVEATCHAPLGAVLQS